MSKRDELEKEANSEKGVFGALALTVLAMGGHAVMKSKNKEQIDSKREEIRSIERQISDEESKFFWVRDEDKIRELKVQKSQLVNELDMLKKKFNQ